MKTLSRFSILSLALSAIVAINADAAITVNSVNAVGVNASGAKVSASSMVAANSASSRSNSDKMESTNSDMSSSLNLSIGGDEVRKSNNMDTTIWSSSQVQSDDQLIMYAKTIAHNDTSVNEISSEDNSVTVTFSRPARLFGFIPVSVKERATVDVDSKGKTSVSVNKSWWSFLASGKVKSDDIKSRIESKLASEGSLSSSTRLSASAKAKILSDIQVASNSVYGSSIEVK